MDIPIIDTSYKMWINGNLVQKAGEVAADKQHSVPSVAPKTVFFDTVDGKNEIIIQVSNFYYRYGGCKSSFVIGSKDQIIFSQLSHK